MKIEELCRKLSTLRFQNVSILIASLNETHSLSQTVETIRQTCAASDIAEIILAVSGKFTTADCMATCRNLQEQVTEFPVRIVTQRLPFAGGAYRDAFAVATGSHLIMMASDLETNPNAVQHLIAKAKENPGAVICASRWIGQGTFKGYNPVKYIANFVFQKFFSLLYGTHLTDLTFAYRLMPTSLAQAIRWEELRHPFFLETILKPLRLNVATCEIPTDWKAREEGESQNPFWRNFLYFGIGFKTRFSRQEQLLQP